ncbi:MAG: sigma-70 family RNA polymerase sigma factor [Muribaculaceae bacterium]|nr:sigma-70 family RNA polymerase sigma factor [Muribaculaceae bacterium]
MYALRLVGDIYQAEDLVQEAFLKAWNQLDEGKAIVNFKAWIYRCVRNECISFLRGKRERADVEEIPEAGEEAIDTSERDARIWRAVDELPEKCREIFLMSKRDGMTGEEIASELGISIKTVKNQMTKALSRLREALSEDHKPFFLPFL